LGVVLIALPAAVLLLLSVTGLGTWQENLTFVKACAALALVFGLPANCLLLAWHFYFRRRYNDAEGVGEVLARFLIVLIDLAIAAGLAWAAVTVAVRLVSALGLL
jgi:hypothetical protein